MIGLLETRVKIANCDRLFRKILQGGALLMITTIKLKMRGYGFYGISMWWLLGFLRLNSVYHVGWRFTTSISLLVLFMLLIVHKKGRVCGLIYKC